MKFNKSESGIEIWDLGGHAVIENYNYYLQNQSKFVNANGNSAKFSDVFKSQREVYVDILEDSLYGIVDIFGKGSFESGGIVDHMLEYRRTPYYRLFPSYVPPLTPGIKLMPGWYGSPEDLRYKPGVSY